VAQVKDEPSAYHAFVKGWTDGAKAGPMRDSFMLSELRGAYADGHKLGKAARVEAHKEAFRRFGMASAHVPEACSVCRCKLAMNPGEAETHASGCRNVPKELR